MVGEPTGVLSSPAVPCRHRVDLGALTEFSAASGWPFALDFMERCHPGLSERAAARGLFLERHAVLAQVPRGVVAPDVTILDGAIEELGTAHRLACRVFGRDDSTPADLLAHLHQRWRRGSLVVAVAGPCHAPVATAAYRRAGAHAELIDVVTDPSVRHRGLATTVLARLERHAATTGVHRLVSVAEDDEAADWYRRRGYRDLGTLVSVRTTPAR